MRASYVNGPEHLTKTGNWIAARLPHGHAGKPWPWVEDCPYIVRVYGLKPLYRQCIFEFWHSPKFTSLTVLGWSVFMWKRRTK